MWWFDGLLELKNRPSSQRRCSEYSVLNTVNLMAKCYFLLCLQRVTFPIVRVSEVILLTKQNLTITNSDGVKEKLHPEVIANAC